MSDYNPFHEEMQNGERTDAMIADNTKDAIDELMKYNSESRFVEKRIDAILEDIEDEIQKTFENHVGMILDIEDDADIYDPLLEHFVKAFRIAINDRFGGDN